jgi:hypothetical protein
MTFTLTYRQGSFRQSEDFVSQIGAVARAYFMLEGIGCYGHQIDEDGRIILHESEIIAGCEAAARTTMISSQEISISKTEVTS